MPPLRPFISSFCASSSLRRASSCAALIRSSTNFGFFRLHQRRIDRQPEQRVLAGEAHLHHAAAGRAFDFHGFELLLRLVDLGLHGLRLAHDLRDVFHRSASFLRAGAGALVRLTGIGTTSPPRVLISRLRTLAISAPGKCFNASATNGWRFSSSSARASSRFAAIGEALDRRRRGASTLRMRPFDTACALRETP